MLSVFHFFTWLGDWERVVPIGLVILGLLLARGWKREAIILLTSVLSAKLLSVLFKLFFAAERPDPSLWLTDASGYSFPSGHATVAMALYGTLAMLLWPRLAGWKKYLLGLICTLLVLGIGFSRLALGVHWFTDVLGGWLLGLATAVLVTAIFKHTNNIHD